MDDDSFRQARGVIDLAEDGIEALVTAIAEAHADVARGPYAALRWAGLRGELIDGIEGFQEAITAGVYQAILQANRVAGAAARTMLERRREKQESA